MNYCIYKLIYTFSKLTVITLMMHKVTPPKNAYMYNYQYIFTLFIHKANDGAYSFQFVMSLNKKLYK